MMSIFGICVSLLNAVIVFIIEKNNLIEGFNNPNIYLVFIITLVTILTRNIITDLVRLIHVSILILISIIGIFGAYNSFSGLGFFCLAVVLSFKYGFLNSYPKTKLVIAGIVISFIVELSAYLDQGHTRGVGISIILFFFAYLMFLYTIYKSDIDSIESSKKELEKNLSQLIAERSQLESNLSEQKQLLVEYEQQIKKALVEETGNLEKFRETYGLTKKEMEVLIIVYETGKTNQEIAEDLHIAVGTVKQHLSRSYTKLDVRNRTQMQAMLREFRTTGILPETMPKHEVLI